MSFLVFYSIKNPSSCLFDGLGPKRGGRRRSYICCNKYPEGRIFKAKPFELENLVLRPLLRLFTVPESLPLWVLVPPCFDWPVEADRSVSELPERPLLRLWLWSWLSTIRHRLSWLRKFESSPQATVLLEQVPLSARESIYTVGC